MINDAIAKSYEAASYASHAYEQSFIANLHARARLRGLNPKAPNSAKVLEIGCASGGNLIAQALVFKDAQFSGIDLSKAQIKNGKIALEKIGIKNIDLLCLDICDATAYFGSQKFDYIIAHGVYSWVPPFVQKAILELCGKLLSKDGVAMISYNVYPGWKFKEITRDFMRFASSDVSVEDEPERKLDVALSALAFEQAFYRTDLTNDSYQLVTRQAKAALGTISHLPRHYLIHDYLELCNYPAYFCDFVADGEDAGLAYVDDMQLCFDTKVLAHEALRQYEKASFASRVQKEQMHDFLNATAFRHSLLTLKENESALKLEYKDLEFSGLFIGIKAKSQSLKERSKNCASHALICALLDAYPGAISCDEASRIAGDRLAECVFELISKLDVAIYFSSVPFNAIKYEAGKSRIRADYLGFLRFLASPENKNFVLCTPKNGVYALHKNDCEAVFMMDGTHSKDDIVAHFVELCQKNNAAPSRIIDGKKVLIESKKEQEAYFDEAISTLISDLEAQCMFESIS